MSAIRFRMAAKTDVGRVRTNNEDNFQAAADLAAETMTWVNNKTCDLGPYGALMVVADGMGGMNAGEVASEIAINTVKDYFTAERLTPEVLKNRFTIEKFMKEVAVEADRRIKNHSTAETSGMGTTIVMAWMLDSNCYVCWCGDSRAYLYNPECGLIRLSKDHSYVQTLVDAGEITDEQAFDYPNSNVITRCLCDAAQKAVPDCLLTPQPLCNGDIFMLCSDGLCGMLRDNEMESIFTANSGDIGLLTDALIEAALAAGGHDNVTVAIASIDEGGATHTAARLPQPASRPVKTETASESEVQGKKCRLSPAAIIGIVAAICAIIGAAAFFALTNSNSAAEDRSDKTVEQTVIAEPEPAQATSAGEAAQSQDSRQDAQAPAQSGNRSGNTILDALRDKSKALSTGAPQPAKKVSEEPAKPASTKPVLTPKGSDSKPDGAPTEPASPSVKPDADKPSSTPTPQKS